MPLKKLISNEFRTTSLSGCGYCPACLAGDTCHVVSEAAEANGEGKDPLDDLLEEEERYPPPAKPGR